MNAIQNRSPMPPQALRERVSGSSEESWFDKSGALTVGEWARALASQGLTFHDCQTIIDFGCGCGRALRHLQQQIRPSQKLIGLDPDGEAIAWVARSLPGVTAYTLDELPPSRSVDTASANLILSHSVFTHLPEDVQFAWLSELARMLTPGGLLITSVHGAKVVNEYAKSLIDLDMADASSHFARMMNEKGFHHVLGKNAFEAALPSYYGAAFHDISYVQEHWSQDFEIRAWFPTFGLKHQDVLVLCRR